MNSKIAARAAARVGKRCRCTGYRSIVANGLSAAALSSASPIDPIEAAIPASATRQAGRRTNLAEQGGVATTG